MNNFGLMVSLSILIISCSSRPLDYIGSLDAGITSADFPDAQTAFEKTIILPGGKPPVECGSPGSDAEFYSNRSELKNLMSGRWIFCEGIRPIGPANQVGIDILPDGRFTILIVDKNNRIIRGQGFDYEGNFFVINEKAITSGSYFKFDTQDAILGYLSFRKNPRKMRFSFDVEEFGTYISAENVTSMSNTQSFAVDTMPLSKDASLNTDESIKRD